MSLSELFAQELRYVVPLYQRPYVWEEEKEWQPLWGDVRSRAEAVLSRVNPKEKVPPHFLGTIVTREVDVYGLDVRTYEVIDGQQRLTTLQVFLAACRDRFAVSDPTGMGHHFMSLTTNTRMPQGDEQRFKVWPTNADRDAFANVVGAGSNEAVQAWVDAQRALWRGTPRLAKAYAFFGSALDRWLRGADEDGLPGVWTEEERRVALFEALRQQLLTVRIELESEDDPQVIFETLNALGQPLMPSDLVRNFIFREAQRNDENTDALYARYWKHFDASAEDPFWKEPVSFGRETRERFDLFLFHFLSARTGEEFGLAHLFATFKRWWHGPDGPRSVDAGLATLSRYASAYREIVEPTGETRFALFCRRLDTLETSTAYPVLLHLLVERDLAPVILDRVATLLESFLIRRLVCRLTSKNLNRVFLALTRTLKSSQQLDESTVARALMESDSTSGAFPDDRTFRRHWMTVPLYDRMRRANLNLILTALDLQLTTRLQERVHVSSNTTIEHVMPVSWNEQNWPLPTAEVGSDETSEERRSRLIHTIGNLTLLTQALNSTVSNSGYAQKRGAITGNSALRLNAYFQDRFDWDEDAILQRGEKLFEIAREVWPPPPTLASSTDSKELGPGEPIDLAQADPVDDSPDGALTPDALETAGAALRALGHPGAEVVKVNRHYCQARPRRWWKSVHYEAGNRSGQAIIGLHVELPSGHGARGSVVSAAHQLIPAVGELFPGYEINWLDHAPTHRGLEVSLPPEDTTADRVTAGLTRLIDGTWANLHQAIAQVRDKTDSEA